MTDKIEKLPLHHHLQREYSALLSPIPTYPCKEICMGTPHITALVTWRGPEVVLHWLGPGRVLGWSMGPVLIRRRTSRWWRELSLTWRRRNRRKRFAEYCIWLWTNAHAVLPILIVLWNIYYWIAQRNLLIMNSGVLFPNVKNFICVCVYMLRFLLSRMHKEVYSTHTQ